VSSSPARRARLAMARRFPQAYCPDCHADLGKIFNVVRHLARCTRQRLSTRGGAP